MWRMHRETNRWCGQEIRNNYCPLCILAKGEKVVQTKEHILTGQCWGTKDLQIHMEEAFTREMEKGGWKEADIKMLQEIVCAEERDVSTTIHTLENHGKAAVLMGLWSNKTILKCREAISRMTGCGEDKAMQVTLSCMKIKQEFAQNMCERFRCNKEIWLRDIQQEERDIMTAIITEGEDTDLIRNLTGRPRVIHLMDWKGRGSDEIALLNTKEGRAAITDMALEMAKTEDEIRTLVKTYTGRNKRKWLGLIREEKRWIEDPREMTARLLYTRPNREGRRNLKRSVEKVGWERVVEDYKAKFPARENLLEKEVEKLQKQVP